MSKHTQGPWGIQPSLENGPYGPPLTIIGPEKALVASIKGACLHDPRHQANARLIAAAPEMLEALEGILREMWDHIGKRDVKKHASLLIYEVAARNAIAKATG